MSSVTIEFAYNIGDKVRIVPLEMVGQVDGLLRNSGGCQYSVIYWSEGTRKTTWMYSWELADAK